MDPGVSKLPPLRWPLVPLSVLYGAGMRARNVWYQRRRGATRRAGLRVISIGNITVGGTGKTPLVMEVVRRLQALGRNPAIVTRGYGAGAGETADEVAEFAQQLPGVPVLVEPDRVAGAAAARHAAGADCVVLDDGFQHRRLRRDLDIVVIDALDPWGGGWVLPAGRLREPLAGLGRADLLVISRVNQVDAATAEWIATRLAALVPAAPVLCTVVELESVTFGAERVEAPGALAYHNVLPVCGLGNPATFLRSVEQVAGRVCQPLLFGDHQRYGAGQVRQIVAAAERLGADLVVTTRKDWVKLAGLWSAPRVKAGLELARLDVRIRLQDDAGLFDEHLAAALARRDRPT